MGHHINLLGNGYERQISFTKALATHLFLHAEFYGWVALMVTFLFGVFVGRAF